MKGSRPADLAPKMWLADLPQGWRILKFKRLFDFVGEPRAGDYPVISLTRKGIVDRDIVSNEGQLAASYEDYPVIEPDTFVLNPMDLVGGWAALSPFQGRVSGAYFSFRLSRECVRAGYGSKFFEYLLQTHFRYRLFEPFGVGVGRSESGGGRWTLNRQTLREFPVPVPPVGEQRRIADFLDRETAKIDTLIAKQEQLITTLDERRGAVISRAVTLGIDSEREIEDSGVGWFGPKPADWVMSRIGREFILSLGKAVNAGGGRGELELPYMRAGNIQDSGIDLSEVKTMSFSLAEASQLELKKGDVVVVEGGAGYGRSDLLRSDLPGWGFQNHVIRARSRGTQSSGFLNYFIKHLRAIGHFERLGSFATIPNVSSDKLAQIELPRMSLEEGERIANYLDAVTEQTNRLISTTRQAIVVLKERRQALISAAVTGKLEVTNGYS